MSVSRLHVPAPMPPNGARAPQRRRRFAGLSQHLQTLGDARANQDFLPAHLEIMERPPSPLAVTFTWVLCLMLASAVAWSCFTKIDIFAIGAGRVQPSGRSKVVQPLQTARVKAILTENGSRVRPGTPLIELDSTAAAADLDAKRSALAALETQVVRYTTAISVIQSGVGTIDVAFPADVSSGIAAQERSAMQADINQYEATRQSLLAQLAEKTAMQMQYGSSIEARERLAGVLKERADMKQTLVTQLAGTKTALIDAMQQVEQAAADLAYDRGQLGQAQAAAVSIQKRIEQWKGETLAKQQQLLADALEKRAAVAQDAIKAQYVLAQTQLTSPIDGTVQQLAVNTVGQVVQSGQPLLVIVPSEGPIEVEALIPSKDIAFVDLGQEAVVKVDAFPFGLYGSITGKVVRLSRDAIDLRDAGSSTDAQSVARGQSIAQTSGTPPVQDLVFPVTVALERSTIASGTRDVPLTSGMTTIVEIRTGKRRVIDYVLAPIRETMSSAGHER